MPGCNCEPVEFAHIRIGGNAGTGIKPPDFQGISLCWQHHDEQHDLGHIRFDNKYRINSLGLAAEFAQRSPDVAMKEAMKIAAE